MYKPLSDSTLMGMTKKQIIEQLRIAEHNFFAAEETLAQQIENVKNWVPVVRCSACKYHQENGFFTFVKGLVYIAQIIRNFSVSTVKGSDNL